MEPEKTTWEEPYLRKEGEQAENQALRNFQYCSWDHSKSVVQHQVTLRDLETCQFIYEDGSQCEERKGLYRHHIIHRKDGGQDSFENLVTLCSGHHRMIHREH